jgi:uncharacterized protein (DUF1697 family)
MRYAALLRAVNLVKHNRIAMADLRRIIGELGYGEVTTHLQSGNAVFTSELPPATLEREIAAALAQHAQLTCAVMVRTGPELATVVQRNPLGREPDNPSRYFVSFLAAEPAAAAVAEFARLDLGPEQAWVVRREAYLWIPQGAADTKLTGSFLEKRLGVAGTARNWNTVTRLVALTAG